ncbi:hypothetical protein [Ruminococcus sp. JL13D9]
MNQLFLQEIQKRFGTFSIPSG